MAVLKNLIRKMAAAARRKRTYLARNKTESFNPFAVAEKGHFVIYTKDQRRFTMPLAYLSNDVFLELFRMSEEEYGLSSDGPIPLPCEAEVFDYILSLTQRGMAKDLEKALISSITNKDFPSQDGWRVVCR